MKNKKTIILIIILLLINIATNVMAVEVNIPTIGMKFKVEDNLYDIIQGLQDEDEKVQKLQQAKGKFVQLGIVYDAVDSLEDDISKEFIIMATQNQAAEQIRNLSTKSEEEQKQISEDFFKGLKESTPEVTFDETKIVKSQNGNTYMTILSHQEIETGTVNVATYYTIVAKRLVGITFRYINKEIDNTEINQVIESITFDIERNRGKRQCSNNQIIYCIWSNCNSTCYFCDNKKNIIF